ncbi:SCAR-like protein 2 [Perilla frutescens var. hirtella]|nr:SCAR-like protein 2 [Perilla frutescens var. hirtella]
MPMNRYEIRDEYSLADPELYRAADKDDPEALLEGVAMAGLVGVLRQLGDLAEFAAEIFHDLHEEVMATAARGNSLMIRVQQLEAEVPFIEKAFLSQTDHSSFFYNAGVDWHANLRVDQNLVTQGDLPRFVMDSYEECRGPPRLFLLDKFDVAGAGACLKRYTDPSFFKVEASATANANVKREKKIRKAKKKGPHGRYGETPETVQVSSHARLHQLLLEEPVENGVSIPAYRAKLKRRPNGFLLDSRSGKSYMTELLKNPSPEHTMLDEITVCLPLPMSGDDHNEPVLELISVSPARESEGRKSNPPYADKEEIMLNPTLNQSNDASAEIKTYGLPSYDNIVSDGIPSTSDEETGGKDIAIDGENKTDGSLISYQSDEIASEIDNYVDAPSTMESEMDTDSELRVKNDFTSYIKNQPLVSVKNQDHCHSLSLDSQSTGDFSISDEGNNSYKKEMSSFLSSDSPRTSAENQHSEKSSADGFPSADIPEFATVNASSFEKPPEHFPVDEVPKPVSYNTFPGKNSALDSRPYFEQPASSFCSSNSIPTLLHYDSRAVAIEGMLRGAKSDETISNSDDNEKKRGPILCSPIVSYSKSLRDDSQRTSSGEHLVDDEIPYVSTSANIIYHTSDSLDAISAYSLHEDDYDQKDLNQCESRASTVDMDNIIYQNRIDTIEIVSKENPTPGKLDIKVAKLTNNFATDYTETAHNGDKFASKVSENQNNYLCTEDPNVVYETVDAENHCYNRSNVNQLSAERLILSGISHSPVFLEAALDTHDTDFTPEEPTTINGTSELGDPNSSEVGGLQVIGITDDVTLNDLVALESSFHMPENQEDSSGTSYTAEMDRVNPDGGITGLQATEISSSLSPKLLSWVPVSLDEFDPSADQRETTRMACSIPADSDNTIRENVSSPAGPGKVIEEHAPCIQDPGLGELTNVTASVSGFNRESEVVEEEKSDLSVSHGESCLVEEVMEREVSAIDFAAACRTEHNDHLKPEVSHTNFSSYLDSEVRHRADVVSSAQTQPPPVLSGLNTKDESFQQSTVENQVSNVDSLHTGCAAEESPENIELPPASINNELPDSSKIISSELSSALPTSQMQTLDDVNDKGFDNFASSSPPVNNPPSAPVLPALRDSDTDASEYPKDPLGFAFSPDNPFSETNLISHPLPPLPPLQWRIGKLQHASSITKVDKTEIKEVFPQEIFPAVTSTGYVRTVREQMIRSPIERPQITFKEENLEHGCPSLEADSVHEMIGLPQQVENEQPQLFTPMKESEVQTPAEEVGVSVHETIGLPQQVENEQPQLFRPMKESEVQTPAEEVGVSVHEAIGLPQQVENEQPQPFTPTKESEVQTPAEEVGVAEGSQTVKMPVEVVPQLRLKEENAEHCSPLQADSTNQAVDPPPKVEKEEQLLVMPTQESGVPLPAVEDGVADGSRTMKLPRSCNPVIGSVAALDKSRLRKVTERVKPQIQKQDERDALLDQIRAKSFNLKPTATSRPSIQGPNTNLKVAAILEKANAIRQAAGAEDSGDENSDDSKRKKPAMEAERSGQVAEQRRLPLSEVVSDCINRWFQDTLKEAKTGDINMQVLVGQMYYCGYGISKDANKV